MNSSAKEPLPRVILGIFVVSLLYWIYLAINSQMTLGADASGYDMLARNIHTGGWIEYLKKGPDREPVYLLLITLAMHAAQILKTSYQHVLEAWQVGLLLLTQIMLWRLLHLLNVRAGIAAATLLYFAVSPAMVNSALSLYSEIITYPFVLGILFLGLRGWQAIVNSERARAVVFGLLLGLTAGVLCLAKALFEYVFLAFLLCFLYLGVQLFLQKKIKPAALALILLLCAYIPFKTITHTYKSLNKTYNGYYTITDRGPYILYEQSLKRTENLSSKKFLLALSCVPGDNICYSFFKRQECNDWLLSFTGRGDPVAAELLGQGVLKDKIYPLLSKLSLENAMRNPGAFAAFSAMESLKMFFWESTKTGFVNYPAWLDQLYDTTIFKNGLRLSVAVVTVISFIFLIVYAWKRRAALVDASLESQKAQTALLMLGLMLPFIALYCLVIVLIRYAFPIVPLYLAGIAFCANELLAPRK